MQQKHTAFTLIELLVVITIVAVMVAMLLPAVTVARDVAAATVCASNMRQIGIAINNYATDNQTRYPYGTWRQGVGPYTFAQPTITYDILVDPYLGGKGMVANDANTYSNHNPTKLAVLTCPKDRYTGDSFHAARSYAMTPATSGGDNLFSGTTVGNPPASIKLDQVPDPSGTFLLGEMPNNAGGGRGRQGGGSCSAPFTQSGALTNLVNPYYVVVGNPPYTIYTAHPLGCATHPGDTFNYLFADNHIKSFFPLDTDPRPAGGGAPRAGMRGFGSGPTGYYWYNSAAISGAWSLSTND